MFGFSFGRGSMESIAERMRRFHSAWLTRAIRRGGGRNIPRIPVRVVSEGGFEPLMSTFEGREWAEAWWNEALGGEQAD